MPSAVQVDGLRVRYGDLTAVDAISFVADPGDVTVLLGPNGAGKTSTIECLEGYRRPDAGQVRVCGLDPVAEHRRLVPRIGVMLQDGGVYSVIRPLELLHLFASYYDDPRDPAEMLELVGLSNRVRSSWRSLSGGEQQRLSLALALIGRPDVAFLDEPTAGVDLEGKQLIRGLIADLRDGGSAVLLTTHDLEEAEALADRIVILDAGRVVADGPPRDLLSGHDADHFSFRASADLDVVSLGATLGCTVTEISPGDYRVAVTPTPKLVAMTTAWLADRDELVGDLRAGRQRLDDVFLRLTGERSRADTGRSPRSRERSRERSRVGTGAGP